MKEMMALLFAFGLLASGVAAANESDSYNEQYTGEEQGYDEESSYDVEDDSGDDEYVDEEQN